MGPLGKCIKIRLAKNSALGFFTLSEVVACVTIVQKFVGISIIQFAEIEVRRSRILKVMKKIDIPATITKKSTLTTAYFNTFGLASTFIKTAIECEKIKWSNDMDPVRKPIDWKDISEQLGYLFCGGRHQISLKPIMIYIVLHEKPIALECSKIHLIEVGQYEVQYEMSFEEVMYILPNIKAFRCKKSGRKRVISLYSNMRYHKFYKLEEYNIPRLALDFNSGLCEGDTDLWMFIVKFLLKEVVSCAFTSYAEDEVMDNFRVLDSWGANIMVAGEENEES
ncbi:190_t:CDS:2 [Acaulospora morrowiae]|uniref:190_t:CDS:1 n=1 Tax=Acaulospora morrowiae TaxID=94023 RepID=A0A9N8W134_9GLOM|nr:190_t:CDS:2 [Acaulospora morrowiae]